LATIIAISCRRRSRTRCATPNNQPQVAPSPRPLVCGYVLPARNQQRQQNNDATALGKTGPVTTNETRRSILRQAAVRVPEVTVIFWITKGLTTGMGESSSDYLVHRLPPVLAVALGGIALLAALGLQFAAGRYVPWIYWLAVAMVGVFGTMAADVLHVGLGVPYVVSTSFFAVALAVIFVLWWAMERTLSIHSIYTRRREVFYWAAVMTTFVHRRGRHDRHHAAPWLFVVGPDVRGRDRRPGGCPLAVRDERDLGLLVGLHRHSAAGCLLRGLDGGVARSGRP
jgi:Repeat of Unknown Function (DUF347)